MFFNWKKILTGKTGHPYIPNLRETKDDSWRDVSLTRGQLVMGKPGAGKTVWMAQQTVAYALKYPNRPIISLDASGSFTDEMIKRIYQLPPQQREQIDRRIIYDRLGDSELVVPMPFFSPEYDLNYEEQVQRVSKNFEKMSEHLITRTPVMALSITETGPQLNRLLCAIQNEHGECWQITEAKKLLSNIGWLRKACKQYGYKVPEAKWYFEKFFLSRNVSDRERELRTYTLRSMLGMIEPRNIRARVGYYKPGWTTKEMIEKGLIVLASGERLINQEQAQAILFNDIFSHVLSQINKRIPHDRNNMPVLLTIDEVPMLLKIPGMAEEIGKISPQYRSRNLMIVVVIQALWQLADNLKEQIWSLGNVTCFGVEDFNESYQVAQQLFQYDPVSTKLPPASETSQPVVEPDRGQYLTIANWIQHLNSRECVLKRYRTEGQEERFVGYVRRTKSLPTNPINEPLNEIKERLLKRRAIPIKDALEMVNQRKLTTFKRDRKRRTIKN